MIPCPSCSAAAPGGSRFCPDCGAPIESPSHSPTRAEPPAGATSARGTVRSPSGRFGSSDSSEHGRFLPGTVLADRFRIVGLLGKGGMGEVYRADDLRLGQAVALKFLPEQVARDPAALERFRREVSTARQVANAYVCRVYDIAEIEGQVFLSMEYIDGEDLSHALRRLGRPSREKAIEIARQLCLGLAAAHENGVLHRDLKPANIMIDGRGRVRITDFGLAGLADDLAAAPERVGTPAYMAPEQLESGKASVRSDVYSLGLILYEVFSGKRAFEGESLEDLRRLRTSGSLSTPSSLAEALDPAVERVILRCLEPDPQRRPPSVYAVLGALPGGDPLAAALAAGETPSPELVANAGVEGSLKPRVAIPILLAVFFVVIGSAHLLRQVILPPEKPPEVLYTEAEQALEELGYRGLSENSASGYEVNGSLRNWLSAHPQTGVEAIRSNWRPVYTFWRRWSPGSLETSELHFAQPTLDNPPQTLPGSASVELDSTGRLLGLSVIPESDVPDSAATKPDWTVLLRRSRIPDSDLVPAPPATRPPSYSDEIASWRVEKPEDQGGPFTVQAGAVGGRPNYFEIVGPAEAATPGGARAAVGLIFRILNTAVYVAAIFLAWRNLRLGRVDRKSAFRCALFMLALYVLLEVLSFRIHEPDPIDWILGLFGGLGGGRAAGHILLHTLNVWVMYLAIEPYVRRIWPRMLVGVVRLLSGRARDPLVGREVLVGTIAGVGLTAFAVGADLLARRAGLGDQTPFLPTVQLHDLAGSGRFGVALLGAFAFPVLDTLHMVTTLLVMRFLTGRNWAAAVLGGILMGLNYYANIDSSMTPPLAVAVGCAAYGLVMVLVITRVGLLAAYAAQTMILLQQFSPLTTDLSAWYGPYAIAGFVVIFAVAGYGFWTALAGQPIFRDILAPERPARI